MESDLNKQHPFIQLLSTLDEKGVVVTDSVEGVPVNEESYVSPDMLIVLCHQGTMLVDDSPQLTFKAHDIAILLPDQLGFSQRPSADYRTTWIAISKKFHVTRNGFLRPHLLPFTEALLRDYQKRHRHQS